MAEAVRPKHKSKQDKKKKKQAAAKEKEFLKCDTVNSEDGMPSSSRDSTQGAVSEGEIIMSPGSKGAECSSVPQFPDGSAGDTPPKMELKGGDGAMVAAVDDGDLISPVSLLQDEMDDLCILGPIAKENDVTSEGTGERESNKDTALVCSFEKRFDEDVQSIGDAKSLVDAPSEVMFQHVVGKCESVTENEFLLRESIFESQKTALTSPNLELETIPSVVSSISVVNTIAMLALPSDDTDDSKRTRSEQNLMRDNHELSAGGEMVSFVDTVHVEGSYSSLNKKLERMKIETAVAPSAPEPLYLPDVREAPSAPSIENFNSEGFNTDSLCKPTPIYDANEATPDSPASQMLMTIHKPRRTVETAMPPMVMAPTPRPPKVVHRKIPTVQSLTREESMRPFTESQLKALYLNRELENNQAFIAQFVEEYRSIIKHEFYELLAGYLRSRNNLQISTKDIQMLQQEYGIAKDQLWITTEHVAQAKGHCEDGKLVTGSYQYHKAKFNESVGNKVSRLLQQIREQLYDHYSLHAYSAQMAHLQVESYLHKLLLASPDLKDIPHNTPVKGCVPSQLSPSLAAQVVNLRQCISILFHFQRKPIKDKTFMQETRTWLTRLVAVLLRVATFDDHLFLLNHILRCPAGVEEWAVSYVQPPAPTMSSDQDGFGGPNLDHTMTTLATLLMPIKGREDFLQHVKAAVMTASLHDDDDSLWVLIDSEGEEDEDPTSYWLHWRENDLVSLLNQIPVEAMFRHVLRIDRRDEVDFYDVNLTSEHSMLRLLAFATQLISILKEGLKTFNLVRYRQLAKRLSRLVRHTVQYISDHWLNFKTRHLAFDSTLGMRLQVEFDQFFLRATYCIFSSQRLGAWQFMAGLPYTCVSTPMLWQIIRLLHSKYQDDKDLDQLIQCDLQVELHDKNLKTQFEENLLTMPECEAYYLLTAFANMACSRTDNAHDFVDTIVMEIYEIAFVSSHTREMCSKGGRELLSMVASKHPFIISRLIQRVRETMTQVGMVSLYLFRELPLYLWHPNLDDYSVVVDWLLSSQLTSPPNLLARLILSAMNWGLDDKGELCLAVEQHRKVAVMVVEAYMKLVPGKSGLIAESFKQVSNIASMVCQTPTAEQAFCQWAWDLLLQLRLHLFSQPEEYIREALESPVHSFQSLPSIQRDPFLQPLVAGVRDKHPAACYVAVVMTTIGHSIAELESNWPVMTALVESYQYRATIHVLSLITPMFYMNSISLAAWDHFRFQPVVHTLLMCDLTYMKMAKNLVLPEFPGKYLRLFVAMILHSADMTHSLQSSKSAVFVMWLEVICKMNQWSRDRNALYIVDSICRAAFPEMNTMAILRKFFVDYYKATTSQSRGSNPVSSFLWWVATGSSSSSAALLSRPSCPDFPWFSFMALDVEADMEEESQIWKLVAIEMLANNRTTPDTALKKVAGRMHITVPPLQQLAIYHWAQQAVDTAMDHPLNPLFWQRFFGLFLQRWPPELGQPEKGSVGSRLFDSMSNVPLFKRMKKRLHDLVDYHNRQLKEVAKSVAHDAEGSVCEEGPDVVAPVFHPQVRLHQDLSKLFNTLVLWLDEPRLHDGTLYLPALPPQYDSARMLLMQHNNKTPWLDFVDFEQLVQHHRELTREWLQVLNPRIVRPCPRVIHEDSASDQVLKRLHTYEDPIAPPPISPLKAPVPEVTDSMLTSGNVAINSAKDHFRILTDYARLFSQHLCHQTTLDKMYFDMLPNLYQNVDSEMTVVVACKQGTSGLLRSTENRCTGPACISLRFKAKKLMESTQVRVEQNRTEWQEVQQEVMLPPPQHVCSAAVFIENVVVYVVKKFQHHRQSEQASPSDVQEVGVCLFNHLHQLISIETNLYPPTRQFLTSSIEVLGREFVSGNPNQCEPLLKTILRDPGSVGLLAPHFTPAAASKETFIHLYSQMVSVSRIHSPDLAFVLLTKFDLSTWLTTCRPRLNERQQILLTLGEVLLGMGLHPDPSQLPMYEIYRNHMQILLLYQFPDHYGDILQLLFKGSEAHSISVDVWHDVLNSLLLESCTAMFPLSTHEEVSGVCQSFAKTQILFSPQQLQETLQLFHNHFIQKRQMSRELAMFGLYSKFQPYVAVIGNFLALISHGLVASLRQGNKQQQNFEFVAEQEVWPVMCQAFSPWVQPLRFGGKNTLPWVPSDVQLASCMVMSLTESIKYLHRLANYPAGLMSAFLDYYLVLCNAPDASTYLMATCYNQVFMRLEWPRFHPNAPAMQFIIKILNSGNPDCLHFLASVFIQLNWEHIVEVWLHTEPPLTMTQHMENLAHLLVRLSFEPTIKEGEEIMGLIQAAEKFPWQFVDAGTYENVVKSFSTNCDGACVLALVHQQVTLDAVTLRLLKICSGLVNWPTALHPETSLKRCFYIRTFMQLLCSWTNKNKSLLKDETDNIIKVLVGLFQDIEEVMVIHTPPPIGYSESVPLLIEALNLVNYASVAELQDVAIHAIQSWAASHPDAILLAPCLHAVCCGLASVIHMVNLTEALINIYFTEDKRDRSPAEVWGPIVTAVKVPDLTKADFLVECLRQGAFLTLYTTVLQQQTPGISSNTDLALLTQLVDWVTKTRPNEESEGKLLLLWNRIVELAVVLAMAQVESEAVCTLLVSFSQTLLLMGEDKASAGFLGAIGLGKKSSLTFRFRFAARAVAAFILSQITPNGTLRLQSSESSPTRSPPTPRTSRDVCPQALASQARTQMESCRGSKQYCALQDQVEFVLTFMNNKTLSAHDYKPLMAYLSSHLFPDKNYLLILRTNEQVGLQLCALFV